MLELLKSKGKNCTGCGACFNICPRDAIRMAPNSEGFLVPQVQEDKCVHCSLCEKSCPVLQPVYHNTDTPAVYALRAEDEIRKQSSSGGTFTLLAEQILRRGGVVFGAAWQTDWTVAHIGVETMQDLPKLRSSKYLQSDTGKSFSQVKQILKAGRPVLYTGCPCQIAGLYAYLEGTNCPQENLYTAEVICHGAPSPRAFQKYLRDNFDVENITKFDFRDKSVYRWSTTCNVYYKDGKEFHRTEKADSYYQAFLPCMIMRPSCASCEFSRLPRQADISMGDYWGVERFDRSWNDGKGTSLVLVNSDKGRKLFDAIAAKAQTVETPMEYATFINKTILHPFSPHPGRKHFYSALDKKPFNQLVQDSLNHHYDIGIVGLWYGINYGSILTYYALYQVLAGLGYDPVLLPKPNALWEERFNAPQSIAQKFIWPRCNVFLPLNTQDQFVEMNDHCTDFVLGSDVVWNYEVCGRQAGMFFFLDWVEADHKKIAYAASFGQKLSGPKSHVRLAQHYLRQFDAISVREDSGTTAVQNECGRTDAAHVLDPVFLCTKETFDKIADSVSVLSNVFVYLLRHAGRVEDVISRLNYVADKFHKPLHICGNPNEMIYAKARFKKNLLPELSVEEWLANIKNSDFVVGDSYHAVCFSLLYHKPFIAVYEPAATGFAIERFRSLLRLVGLEDRLLTSWQDEEHFKALVDKPIDWEQVDQRLAESRVFSEEWLKKALTKEHREYTEQDYLDDQEKRRRCTASLERYDLHTRLCKTEQALTAQQNMAEQLEAVQHSTSYRIGRAITWLPRKVRGGYRCVRENGWKYTIRHFGEKVRGKFHH